MMITTENQFPQDPTHEFQATDEAEEEPLITDPNIDLDIDHQTPTEQVQAPEEPPEDPITVKVQPPTTETNRADHPSAGVLRSSIVRMHTKLYTPSMSGNRYAYADAQMAEH